MGLYTMMEDQAELNDRGCQTAANKRGALEETAEDGPEPLEE